MTRTFRFVLFALLMLVACTAPAAAQTVLNPTTVEFKASTLHSATRLDGSAVVTSYQFDAVGMAGSGALAISVGLGKPTPDAQGRISVAVPQLATLTPNVVYAATVTTTGPDGSEVSAASNPFGRSAPQPPTAVTELRVR